MNQQNEKQQTLDVVATIIIIVLLSWAGFWYYFN
jgi:hypothetical protein